MKKLLILATLLITLSCSKEVSTDTPVNEALTEVDGYQKISFQEARSIAETAYLNFEDEATKGVTKRIINNSVIEGNSTVTKGGESAIDTLLYIFNYANDEGYVVIPTNNVNGQIVAYIEQGNFNIQDTLDNELSKMLVHLMINNQLRANAIYEASLVQTKNPFGIMETIPVGPMCRSTEEVENPTFPSPGPPGPEGNSDVDYAARYGCYRPVNQVSYTTVYNKRPLLTTTWDQYPPFNDFALMVAHPDNPAVVMRGLAGCVPVAVSQIMAYHAWPTVYPKFPQNIIAAWSETLTHLSELRNYRNCYSFDDASETMKQQVAKLLRITGVLLNCTYTFSGGTYAFSEDVPECLYKLGYKRALLKDYNISLIKSSLNQNKPLYMSGSRISNQTTGAKAAHAWVVDGYKTLEWRVDRYGILFNEKGKFTKTKYISTGFAEEELVHCNFGWIDSGSNGYYIDGVFNTSNPQELTGDRYLGGRLYEYDLKIIPFITKN